MQLPRFAGIPHFIMPATLLFALFAPGLAPAEHIPTRTPAGKSCDSQDENGPTLTDEQRLRALAILFTTMTYSGEHPPPDYHPPYVVKPPHRPAHWKQPHHGTAGGGRSALSARRTASAAVAGRLPEALAKIPVPSSEDAG